MMENRDKGTLHGSLLLFYNMKRTFTIEEIRNYLISKDSIGDLLYFLNVENIIKANELTDEEIDEAINEDNRAQMLLENENEKEN